MTERNERVVRQLVAVAADLGAQPSQVALAWLLTRPGVVIPIIAASKANQMAENLGCLDIALDDQQLAALDQASSIDLGFPHDFLRQKSIKRIVYGDQYELIQDRRLTGRRAPADDLLELNAPQEMS